MAKKTILKPARPQRTLVRFDWFIKYLLRDKIDFKILEGFLSELLREDVKILEIVESETNKQDEKDKFNRVDVLVKTRHDERIIVEVQNTKELDYLQRIFFGTSKTMTENMHKGFSYKNVKRIISISVLYFDLGIGEDYIYCGETTFRGMHYSDTLKLADDQIKFFKNNAITRVENVFAQYYIIQASKFNNVIKDSLDEWVYFFKNSAVKGDIKAKGLDAAQERLDVANLDPQKRREYDAYENLQHSNASYTEQLKFEAEEMAHEIAAELIQVAKIEAEEKGKAEGMEKGKIEMVSNGLANGFTAEQMAQISGLTIKEVQAIQKSLKSKK